MKLVVAATPSVALPTIETLIKEHQVTLVTQPDKPAGRGKKMRASDIANAYPQSFKPHNEAELVDLLQGSDLLITIGYGRLLKLETLKIPKFGGINLHFSLLPRWRGAAPVQRSIEAGDRVTGVTVFQMDSGMDTGPIWHQSEYQMPYGINSIELFDALSQLGAEAVQKTLVKILNNEMPQPQAGKSSIASKVTKDECRLNWFSDAETIIRKIKAFSFNPGVYSIIRGEQIKISDARLSDRDLQPGELNSNGEVGCGSGSIQLLLVTPAGKRTMSALDWINGFKPKIGERFE